MQRSQFLWLLTKSDRCSVKFNEKYWLSKTLWPPTDLSGLRCHFFPPKFSAPVSHVLASKFYQTNIQSVGNLVVADDEKTAWSCDQEFLSTFWSPYFPAGCKLMALKSKFGVVINDWCPSCHHFIVDLINARTNTISLISPKDIIDQASI